MDSVPVSAVPVPEPPAPPAKGAFERLIGVFIEPTETFADIARTPSFIAPLIILIVTAFAMSYTVATKIDMGEYTKQKILQGPNASSIPKDQLEVIAERTNKFSKYKAYAQPLVTGLWLTVNTGLLLLMTNFVFGGTASFKQMFSVVVHAKMTEALFAITAVIVLYLKDASDVDPENIVPANLGTFVTAETSKFLHYLGLFLEPFALLQCVLLGFGIAAAGKLSFGKGLAAVLIPFLIIVLIMSGLSSLR